MRLALNTLTIQPAPLFTKIEAAAKGGFSGIEFHVYEIFDHLIDGGSMEDLRTKLSDHGLDVPSLLGMRNWGDLQHHDYQLLLFEARRRLHLCHNLGARFLSCSTPMYLSDWSQLHHRYQDLLDIGREENCTPAFEFIGHYASINNLRDAVTMLDRTNDENACLTLDSFHFWNGGSSLDDLRALPVERIAHFHINDAAPNKPRGQQDDPDRTLPGQGPIPLKDYIAILREKNYPRYLSLELFNHDLAHQDPFTAAQRAYDSLAALL